MAKKKVRPGPVIVKPAKVITAASDSGINPCIFISVAFIKWIRARRPYLKNSI